MKKEVKVYSGLFKKESTWVIDDEWNPAPSKLALRKLAEANEYLSKIKNLDEVLKGHVKDSSPE
jgi:hypothetical protein